MDKLSDPNEIDKRIAEFHKAMKIAHEELQELQKEVDKVKAETKGLFNDIMDRHKLDKDKENKNGR